jgi:hypothetical protein
MQIIKILVICLRILAVCLLFAVRMAVGGALSGMERIAQQGQPSQTLLQPPLQAEPGHRSPRKHHREPRQPRVISLFPFSLSAFVWESLCLI